MRLFLSCIKAVVCRVLCSPFQGLPIRLVKVFECPIFFSWDKLLVFISSVYLSFFPAFTKSNPALAAGNSCIKHGFGWIPHFWASLNLYYLYIGVSSIHMCMYIFVSLYIYIHAFICTDLSLSIYHMYYFTYWLRINHVWLIISSLRELTDSI